MRKEIPSFMIFELSINTLTGIVILTSLTFCCSKIPELMIKIKIAVAVLIDKHEANDLIGSKEVRLLKRMEKKEIIYMSACDMIYFKKGFLLSACGTLFTYGLLIVNMK
ncbi:hypothetical protein CEXT_413331 [Caerostris extrusa]|uniref:Uncharacterized protein n=1 Tax=Caerostris extrusa TaxID=172846 RepID=A0AAV4N0P7_CAEEX|nr:hypothetical protein CEXT_413331 [Caerostris extrusa]